MGQKCAPRPTGNQRKRLGRLRPQRGSTWLGQRRERPGEKGRSHVRGENFSHGQTEGRMEDNHQKAAKTGSKGTALAWDHNGVHHPLGTPWECEWTICLMLLKDKRPHPWDKQPLVRAQRQARV